MSRIEVYRVKMAGVALVQAFRLPVQWRLQKVCALELVIQLLKVPARLSFKAYN